MANKAIQLLGELNEAFPSYPAVSKYHEGVGKRGLEGQDLVDAGHLGAAMLARLKQTPENQIVLVWLNDEGKPKLSLSLGQVVSNALKLAYKMHKNHVRKGDVVALCFLPSLEFIIGFFACALLGAVAVPVYPPDPRKVDVTLARFSALLEISECKLILSHKAYHGDIKPAIDLLLKKDRLTSKFSKSRVSGERPKWPKLPWVDVSLGTGSVLGQEKYERVICETVAPDDVSYIQFTSGSTGTPKGVLITHRNVLETCAVAIPYPDVGVGWAPAVHDLGLITVLSAVTTARCSYFFSPLSFIRKPSVYVAALHRYKATTTAGPNFAYLQCALKTRDPLKSTLDLSSLQCCGCGGEIVRAATVRKFTAAFADQGLSPTAFSPCYGMAENTLTMTLRLGRPVLELVIDGAAYAKGQVVPVPGPPAAGMKVLTLVGNGRPVRSVIAIVDPDTREVCPVGDVGEIWISSPRKGAGYHNQPDATKDTFCARLATTGADPRLGLEFLRTGDCGFFHEGELFVSGRIKDMVIIGGRNYFCNDLEDAMEIAHEHIRPGCGAIFSIDGDDDLESVVCVTEVKSHQVQKIDYGAVVRSIREQVLAVCGVRIQVVVIIAARSIPKTSSGKVRRRYTREQFLQNSIRHLYMDTAGHQGPPLDSGDGLPDGVYPGRDDSREAKQTLSAPPPPPVQMVLGPPTEARSRAEAVAEVIVSIFYRETGVLLTPETELYDAGIDSASMMSATDAVREIFVDRDVTESILFDCETVLNVAEFIIGLPEVPPNTREIRPVAESIPAPLKAPSTPTMCSSLPAPAFPLPGQLVGGNGPGGPTPPDGTPSAVVASRTCLGGPAPAAAGGGVPAVLVAGMAVRGPDISGADGLWESLLLARRKVGSVSLDDGGDDVLGDFKGGMPLGDKYNDPVTRTCLALVLESLADAGLRLGDLCEKAVGVFWAGVAPPNIQVDPLAWSMSWLLSRALGWKGPFSDVNYACTSSHYALHEARRSLVDHESSPVAVVASLNTASLFSASLEKLFEEQSILSPSRSCLPFGANRDGTMPGEFGAAVILCLASEVQSLRSVPVAELASTAVGTVRYSRFGVHHSDDQQRVMEDALQRAGVTTGDVGYIETSGLGTVIGDQLEFAAYKSMYGNRTRSDIVYGTHTPVFGHAVHTAGLVSLVKVVLIMKYMVAPPNVGGYELASSTSFADAGGALVFNRTPLLRAGPSGLVATMHGYAATGTVAHVVLRKYRSDSCGQVPPRAAHGRKDGDWSQSFYRDHPVWAFPKLLRVALALCPLHLRGELLHCMLKLRLSDITGHSLGKDDTASAEELGLTSVSLINLEQFLHEAIPEAEVAVSDLIFADTVEGVVHLVLRQLGEMELGISGVLLSSDELNTLSLFLTAFSASVAGASYETVRNPTPGAVRSIIPGEKNFELFLQTLEAWTPSLDGSWTKDVGASLRLLDYCRVLGEDLSRNHPFLCPVALSDPLSRVHTMTGGAHGLPSVASVVPTSAPQRREEAADDRGICLVGMSVRAPGSVNTLDDFWRVLSQPERSLRGGGDLKSAYSGDDAWTNLKFAVPLDGWAEESATFRLGLALVVESIADAGLDAAELMHTNVSIFWASGVPNGLLQHLPFVSGYIARLFDWRGVFQDVDYACTSSHSALGLAYGSLRHGGHGPVAVVGATATADTRRPFADLSAMGMTADRCRPFAMDRKGMILSEFGSVLTITTRRYAATCGLRVRSHVRAVSTATARPCRLNTCHPEDQAAVIATALGEASIAPSGISAVEIDGVGTVLGDKLEFSAIRQAYLTAREKSVPPLQLGSHTATFGHAYTAAGLTALVKAALMIQHKLCPPNLVDYPVDQRSFNFAGVGAVYPTAPTPLAPAADGSLAVAIHGYSILGTVAHVILSDRPEINAKPSLPAFADNLSSRASAANATCRAAEDGGAHADLKDILTEVLCCNTEDLFPPRHLSQVQQETWRYVQRPVVVAVSFPSIANGSGRRAQIAGMVAIASRRALHWCVQGNDLCMMSGNPASVRLVSGAGLSQADAEESMHTSMSGDGTPLIRSMVLESANGGYWLFAMHPILGDVAVAKSVGKEFLSLYHTGARLVDTTGNAGADWEQRLRVLSVGEKTSLSTGPSPEPVSRQTVSSGNAEVLEKMMGLAEQAVGRSLGTLRAKPRADILATSVGDLDATSQDAVKFQHLLEDEFRCHVPIMTVFSGTIGDVVDAVQRGGNVAVAPLNSSPSVRSSITPTRRRGKSLRRSNSTNKASVFGISASRKPSPTEGAVQNGKSPSPTTFPGTGDRVSAGGEPTKSKSSKTLRSPMLLRRRTSTFHNQGVESFSSSAEQGGSVTERKSFKRRSSQCSGRSRPISMIQSNVKRPSEFEDLDNTGTSGSPGIGGKRPWFSRYSTLQEGDTALNRKGSGDLGRSHSFRKTSMTSEKTRGHSSTTASPLRARRETAGASTTRRPELSPFHTSSRASPPALPPPLTQSPGKYGSSVEVKRPPRTPPSNHSPTSIPQPLNS